MQTPSCAHTPGEPQQASTRGLRCGFAGAWTSGERRRGRVRRVLQRCRVGAIQGWGTGCNDARTVGRKKTSHRTHPTERQRGVEEKVGMVAQTAVELRAKLGVGA